MKITGLLISVIIAVLSINAMTVEAAPAQSCGWLNDLGHNCKIVNGRREFSCKDGYEVPRYSNIPICLPTSWNCRIEGLRRLIKCDSPLWVCTDTGTVYSCGLPP